MKTTAPTRSLEERFNGLVGVFDAIAATCDFIKDEFAKRGRTVTVTVSAGVRERPGQTYSSEHKARCRFCDVEVTGLSVWNKMATFLVEDTATGFKHNIIAHKDGIACQFKQAVSDDQGDWAG